MDKYEAAAKDLRYAFYNTHGTWSEIVPDKLRELFPEPSRQNQYAIEQHGMICEQLGVSASLDEPGDTAFEAVVTLQEQAKSPPEILDAPDGPGLWWCDLNRYADIVTCRSYTRGNVHVYEYYTEMGYMYSGESLAPLPGRYQRIPEPVWTKPEPPPEWGDVPRVLCKTYNGMWSFITDADRLGIRGYGWIPDEHRLIPWSWKPGEFSIIPHPDNDPALVAKIEKAKG